MRIALALHSGFGLASTRFVSRQLAAVLGNHNELWSVPDAHELEDGEERARVAAEIVASCDVIVGYPSMLEPFLRARQRERRRVRCIVVVLGAMPRGAITLRRLLPLMTSDDVFVANCRADIALINQFVSGAAAILIPFAYDASTYFVESREVRDATRAALGCGENSRLIIYAGRLMLSKNIHTALQAYRAVAAVRPDTRLLLAGPTSDEPFLECGVAPVDYGRTLRQLIQSLDLGLENVRLCGQVRPDHLRSLYNAADVSLNLTLHHDENFGLAQVEAMACGTPVVGTSWGGLRDTIQGGANGQQIPAIVTPLGVKVDWWSAAEAVLRSLATHDARVDSSRIAVSEVAECFSLEQYADRWTELLQQSVDLPVASEPPSSLNATAFARLYWDRCVGASRDHAEYPHGTQAFELYREMIAHYAGGAPEPMRRALRPEADERHIVLLAAVTRYGAHALRIGDPLYPFVCDVPRIHMECCLFLLRRLRKRPVISVMRLTKSSRYEEKSLRNALDWMLAEGIVAWSTCSDERHMQRLRTLGGGLPLFEIVPIARHEADFLVLAEHAQEQSDDYDSQQWRVRI